jgi:rare lipoprotein A
MDACRSTSASPARWWRSAPLLLVALALGGCGVLRVPGLPGFGGGEPAMPPPPVPVVATPKPAPPPPPRSAHDAVPRVEPIRQGAPNVPYELKGESYEPAASDVPVVETGIASWYGHPFHGRRTANGEVYDMHAMTAAHRTMPLPSYAKVRNVANGREIVVRINDRGPFKRDRIIDLSHAAAKKLRISGVARVEVRRLTHDEIRTGAWKQAPEATRLAKGAAPPSTTQVDASKTAAVRWNGGTRLAVENGAPGAAAR